MPLIDSLNGIKIYIYNGEHPPPHVHVNYNEFEAIIQIKNNEVFAGWLPNKQMKMGQEWVENNHDWALQVFYELNPNLR